MPTTSKDRPDSRLLVRIVTIIGALFAAVVVVLFVRSAPARSPEACVTGAGGTPEPAQCLACHISPHRDGRGYTIRRVDAVSHVITTIADDAPLRDPNGTARDARGVVFGASPLEHAAWRRDPNAESAQLVAGAVVAGRPVPGYSGDGGPSPGARLNRPSSVALDGRGRLYIADTLNNRVRRVDEGGTISTVAGNGEKGMGVDGVPATDAAIEKPLSLAFDHNGDLLIAHGTGRAGRVLRMDRETGIVHTIIGGGSASPHKGDGLPARQAVLTRPVEVTVDRDSGDIIVAESRPILRHWNVGACANCHRLP